MSYIANAIRNKDIKLILDQIDIIDNNDAFGDRVKEFLRHIRTTDGGKEVMIEIIDTLIKKQNNGAILNAIYDIKELEKYTVFLLSNRNLYYSPLTAEQVMYFVSYTSFGKNLVSKNITNLIDGCWNLSLERGDEMQRTLFNLMSNNNEIEKEFMTPLTSIQLRTYSLYLFEFDKNKANDFVDNHKNELFYIDKGINEYTNMSLFDDTTVKSKPENRILIETYLSNLIASNASNSNIQFTVDFINSNYKKNNVLKILSEHGHINDTTYFLEDTDEKLKTCMSGQTKIIKYLYDSNLLNVPLIEKYKFLLSLIKTLGTSVNKFDITDAIFTNNLDEYVSKIFRQFGQKNGELNFIGSGVSSIVYRFDDYVVKLGASRFSFECPKHYRIAPSIIRQELKDEKGKPSFYIEVQKYLKQEGITKDHIYELLVDLYADGIVMTDPKALSMDNDNFAYLDHYSQMNTSKKIENEDKGYIYLDRNISVSESFKKSPLVLIDTDLVYLESSNITHRFRDPYSPCITHKDVITGYALQKKRTSLSE